MTYKMRCADAQLAMAKAFASISIAHAHNITISELNVLMTYHFKHLSHKKSLPLQQNAELIAQTWPILERSKLKNKC